MSLYTYIFLLYSIYHLCFTYIDFYDLSAWGGCWFVVYIRRFIYKFLNVCLFDNTAVAGSWKVGPVNQYNHTSWVAVVTLTDRPKSVRNRFVIELFVALFALSLCPFDISVGVGAFVVGLSLISSFFSFNMHLITIHICQYYVNSCLTSLLLLRILTKRTEDVAWFLQNFSCKYHLEDVYYGL